MLKHLPCESDEGNIEYKWKLVNNITSYKINKLASQMLYRLHEGDGTAIYYLGVKDNGNTDGINIYELNRSFFNLIEASRLIDAHITSLYKYKQSDTNYCLCIKFIKKHNVNYEL